MTVIEIKREKIHDVVFLVHRGIPFEIAFFMDDNDRREYINAFMALEDSERRRA